MPTITDWIMVIITGVYVIATALICFFNYRSAKATREQVIEIKKQYEEENRAFITYEILYENRTYFGIRFTNYGKRVARHIRIEFKKEFIDSINEPQFAPDLTNLKEKELVLGIGQSYHVYFGSNRIRKNPHLAPLEGTFHYEDDKTSYDESFIVNIENYATMFSSKGDIERLTETINKQTNELQEIKHELRQISSQHSLLNDKP